CLSVLAAGFAEPTQLQCRLARLETVLKAPCTDEILDRRVGEFRHLSTFFADRESHETLLMTLRMRAGNEGIEAFEAMDQPVIEQLFQCAIDLQRRAETVVTQLVEDRIGAEWAFCLGQNVENQCLIAGQVLRGVMVVMRAHCPAIRFGDACSLLCRGSRLKMKMASAATTMEGPDGVSK